MSTPFVHPEVRQQVSPLEWQTRVELAACYRLVSLFRWEDLVYTHISAKVPGTEEFLINPYGLMFDEITASSLVKVDLSGNKLLDSPYDINPAGFIIHGAIHEARADVGCVLHTHTADGIAVSMHKDGLLPLSQQSVFIRASLAYHPYEGVALNPDERARLQQDLGDKSYLILPNHGLLTCGETVADTFLMMYMLQRTCEIQVKALSCGVELTHVSPQVEDRTVTLTVAMNDRMRGHRKHLDGSVPWPALLRRLDRVNPGYQL
ncbi:class II aldolase [Aromatoleum toluvorans]|uniref:Class II aldolase n=1 Tax=Aromatoleum toluvorans TaxID=92002 RepID=A0ABX1PV20_9RHOO|nr:class II aldolase/adducin family protein [Aromatoleum toluvorans]NMG42465.1 class II aldolase [Aromatoleum toluvorans]